jgi:hypothetical protein
VVEVLDTHCFCVLQPSTADLAAWSPVSVGVEGSVPETFGAAQRGMSVSYNQPTPPDAERSVYFAPDCIG